MLVRYNNLKIIIASADAKPGGNIGAMLSPYLFSNNMNDFCKRFNESTMDYTPGIWLTVEIYCDIIDKLYTFKIKYLSFSLFYLDYFSESKRLNILYSFDVCKYYTSLYKCNLYTSSLILFTLIKQMKRYRYTITFGEELFIKIYKYVIKRS